MGVSALTFFTVYMLCFYEAPKPRYYFVDQYKEERKEREEKEQKNKRK